MNSTKTSKQLLEQLEILPWQKNNKEESKILIQLLKLALHKDKENYDALVENMDEGVAHCKIICDSNGVPYDYKFISVNKAFANQSSLHANKVIGKSVLEIFPEADTFWIAFYGNVALTQQPNSTRRYSPITKKHYISSAYSSTKGEFTMLFKDVTESVELAVANLEIEKKQKQNSTVLENMAEGFAHCKIICDSKGNPIDYKVLSVNKAYEKQTGIKSKNIIGKTILEFYPDIEKSWIEIFGKVALTGKPHSFIDFNHNTNKHYQTNAFSPEIGEFALFFRDVTDQETKNLELSIAQKKAKENDKLKSAFLSNMSHEVRTPMNAILGFSSLLEDDAVSEEDKNTCLKQIKSAGNRLLTIISDIVDISKIDAKQQKLVLKEYDLNLIIDELLNQFSVLNTNSNISIKIKKGSKNDTLIILTDETRLNQILSNLIENALKHTLSGEVIFGYILKDEHLQFYVKDTGIGIKKADHELIFQRFGQITNKASTQSSGTGLGIPIAKGLVTLFEGEIWVESELNKGSTFYFSIPYIPPSKEITNLKHKHTIMIAEDDDVNFLLLNLWLSNHFNVIRATNGFEAVHFYEKNDSIDLIIMDIRMPYLDGIEATKEIRKTNTLIPIIAHTAYAMNEESVSIMKAGCNQVLIKPITKEHLLSVLSEYKVMI